MTMVQLPTVNLYQKGLNQELKVAVFILNVAESILNVLGTYNI